MDVAIATELCDLLCESVSRDDQANLTEWVLVEEGANKPLYERQGVFQIGGTVDPRLIHLLGEVDDDHDVSLDAPTQRSRIFQDAKGLALVRNSSFRDNLSLLILSDIVPRFLKLLRPCIAIISHSKVNEQMEKCLYKGGLLGEQCIQLLLEPITTVNAIPFLARGNKESVGLMG